MRSVSLKYVKWLLPMLFVAYYGCISLFVHVHIEEGTTIVHAHPFKKTADGSCHQHTSLSEIQLFHQLTTVQAGDGAVHLLQLSFFVFPLYKFADTLGRPDFLSVVSGMHLLRAPPFVF